MKKLLLLVSALMIGAINYAQPMKKRLDSMMNYYAQTFNFNGVALIAQKGNVLLRKGYGYKDRYKNIPTGVDGVYQIGSVTKHFTADIILLLAKQHKLSLDDKLSKYFPELPWADSVTIEHLLTHTGGLHNYTEDSLWDKAPTASVTTEQMLNIFKARPLEFTPGTKFEYCNTGYYLLGCIIEKITGKDYYTVVRETILEPVGMTNSGFDYTHLKSRHKVIGYNAIGLNNNLVDSFWWTAIEDSTQSYAAGSLYSTVDDLYKWHKALQNHTILDKEWQDKAYVPHKGNYGYGWMTKDVQGKKAVYHSGGINGFYSYFFRVEGEDICVILLTNIEYGGMGGGDITAQIMKCFFDPAFKVPAPRKEIALSPGIIKQYEGEYILSADTTVKLHFWLKDKYLLMKMNDDYHWDRLLPETASLFFTKGVDARFEFVKNDQSNNYKLMLHQHGMDFEALKKQN